ncbi:MAG TPA: glycine/betaine ABC transporter substrate-binding protein, partial [Pseudonocardiaceae bacterium]|nr:glycine/betaine ABC transporter substrate-binding protein [Pseudonocardiaceae bacterium]
MTRIMTLVMAVVLAAAVTACGSGNPLAGGGNGSAIVVGSADFAESELLMEIYAAALRKAGIQVQT